VQRRLRSAIPSPLRRAGRMACARFLPLGVKGRNYLMGLMADPSDALTQYNVYFDPVARKRLLGSNLRASANGAPEAFRISMLPKRASLLQQITTLDFRTYLPDDILVKVDRASMLASLEVRAPWLDPRLIHLAFAKVPDSLRATTTERKILPRSLAKRVLPPTLDLRRKQGFSLPLHSWLRGEWGRFTEEVLREADLHVFDRRAIQDLISGQRRGRSNSQRIYALTMFELWRRDYRIMT
jgi:asparagine synthase (glutamine-hydrolysing)